MEKEQILGFNVCTDSKETLIKKIFKDSIKNEQVFIVNVNPEIIVANYKNKRFKEILNKQKYQIPDGSGIVWASKKNNGNIKQRIAGIDLMLKICEKSQEYSSNIYLYGGSKGVAEKAKEELEKQFPKIKIVGTNNGYDEEKDVLHKLKTTNIDILFIGTGSPKQEEFIIKHKEELKSIKILMPVGGSFDVISKNKKRAPNWIIKCNLEWMYRLFQEPNRIFRQIKLLKYVYLVLINKKGEDENGKN